jgi:hypothetical protein
VNTLNRSDISASFSLASVASRAVLDVGNSNAVTLYADREFGSAWSTFVIAVKKIMPESSASADFDTPKTFPAGGGVVNLSVSDMLGVARLELSWSSGAAEASGTTARIIATTELRSYESSTQSPSLTATFRQLALSGALSDSPPDPSE